MAIGNPHIGLIHVPSSPGTRLLIGAVELDTDLAAQALHRSLAIRLKNPITILVASEGALDTIGD